MLQINFNRREKKPVKYDPWNYGIDLAAVVILGAISVWSAYRHLTCWTTLFVLLLMVWNANSALQQQEAKRAEEAAKTEDET